MRTAFAARAQRMHAGLSSIERLHTVAPDGAFYAFPNIAKTGWKAKPLASALLEEAGVATIGGPDFGIHGDLPLNTSGGQISAGQPGLAGGGVNVTECLRQLFGEAAAGPFLR